MRPRAMILVVLGALTLATSARAADEVPSSLVGAWDVEHVNVDEQDQMHWGTRPDDPALLGRELLIQRDMVRFTADEEPCHQGDWKPRNLPWAKLFAKSFSRAPDGGRSSRPLPADFGLRVDGAVKVNYYELCPTPEVPPSKASQYQRWVVQRSPDVLVMHYTNQVLLTLRRRAAAVKPRASFDCGRAATPTETAICASHDLAGWDRSVALALRQAIARSPEKEATLRDDQHRWLKKRDTCGTKGDCIRESAWDRVQELTMN